MGKAYLQIRMTGEGIDPETVKASDLAEFITETEKAIEKTAAAHGIALPDEALVSLVKIERGSNLMTLAIDDLVRSGASGVTHAISEQKYYKLPEPTWEALAEISRLASRRGIAYQFLPNPELDAVPATISAREPVPEPPESPAASGTTTIYGKCLRVGGVEPKAEIELSGELTKLFINISKDDAKRLAHRLYEEVGIEGEATWDVRTWVIKSFRATRLLDYQPAPLPDAFREVAEASRGRWSGVNADEHVRALRSRTGEEE